MLITIIGENCFTFEVTVKRYIYQNKNTTIRGSLRAFSITDKLKALFCDPNEVPASLGRKLTEGIQLELVLIHEFSCDSKGNLYVNSKEFVPLTCEMTPTDSLKHTKEP